MPRLHPTPAKSEPRKGGPGHQNLKDFPRRFQIASKFAIPIPFRFQLGHLLAAWPWESLNSFGSLCFLNYRMLMISVLNSQGYFEEILYLKFLEQCLSLSMHSVKVINILLENTISWQPFFQTSFIYITQKLLHWNTKGSYWILFSFLFFFLHGEKPRAKSLELVSVNAPHFRGVLNLLP